MRLLLSTESGNWGLLFVRIAIATAIFPHGAQKLFGWFGGAGYEDTIQAFFGMGLPWLISFLVIVIETFAPIFLILGLFTRIAAFTVFVNFVGVVFVTVKFMKGGFFMNWQMLESTPEGLEYFVLLFGLLFASLYGGGGKWSLDSMLSGKSR